MNYRLISKHGDALGLMQRLKEEGHITSYWVRDAKAREGYKGILPQVDRPDNRLTKDMIILFDMVGLGSQADTLKKNGYKVYGGGKINDALELNREFGMKTARAMGIKVPRWERFNSFDKAKEYIKQGRFVFKPQNNASPAFTYVSSDSEDMTEMLDYFEGIWKGKVDFILQQHIDGTEVSIEQFYRDGEPIANTLNTTLECKKFLEGDKGVNTGCMGSVVRFWQKQAPKLYKMTLQKAEPYLRRFRYSGPLDCNCIVSEKDRMPYFLEWTARFGYDAVYALCEGVESLSGFLSGVMDGKDMPRPDYGWLGAVRVSIPPYPQDGNHSADKPIRGIDTAHTWLLDAKYEDGRLLTAGVDGVVAEITGKSETLSGLAESIYPIIEKMRIPDIQYRSDIISNAERRIEKLREWKYM